LSDTVGNEEKKADDKPKWRFHSQGKNEIVYDEGSILCTFAEHELITDDPELAAKLQRKKYEEWVLFAEDDEIELVNGAMVRLGDLPKQIRDEFIGKPKRAAQDLLGRVKSFSPFSKDSDPSDEDKPPPEDEEPIKENQCPICRTQFDTPSALNGHFAHCKQNPPEE